MIDFRNNAITITGVKETVTALGGIEGKLHRRVLTKALKAGAKIVQTEARTTAPRRTGLMARKIMVRSGRSIRKGESRYKVQTGTRAQMKIAADNKWYYPAIVEYGVAGRFQGKRYMTQAYKSKAQAATDAVINAIRNSLAEAVK